MLLVRTRRAGCQFRALRVTRCRNLFHPNAFSLAKDMAMDTSKLRWIAVALAIASTGEAWGQGTKDPSNPVPSMVYTIRPRDEPAPLTAVPNNSYTQSQRPPTGLRQVRPFHPARVRR